MSKQYLVTVYETHRVIYVVEADSEDEARAKIEHPEESYHVELDEYYDLDRIESVEEDK